MCVIMHECENVYDCVTILVCMSMWSVYEYVSMDMGVRVASVYE